MFLFNENNKTEAELSSYISYMLLLPLIIVIPFFALFYLFYDNIALYESSKNGIVYDFVWEIPIIALFIGYFEIFYAWLRAHMKSVFGSFVKEVFVKACTSLTPRYLLFILDGLRYQNLFTLWFWFMGLVC